MHSAPNSNLHFKKNFIVVKKRTLKKTPCVSKRRFINLLKHCDGEADPIAYLYQAFFFFLPPVIIEATEGAFFPARLARA